MGRMAVRAMSRTDATPYMECVGTHWSAISAWTEDSADLGDADEYEEGDEPSPFRVTTRMATSMMLEVFCFRLRLGDAMTLAVASSRAWQPASSLTTRH